MPAARWPVTTDLKAEPKADLETDPETDLEADDVAGTMMWQGHRGAGHGGPSPERLSVVMERSGGIVGRPVRRGLDAADLPADQADQLRRLATALAETPTARAGGPDEAPDSRSGRGPRGADRFVYTIEMRMADRRVVRTFGEPVPEPLRPLVAMLSRAPLLRN